jgi:hypothetical protein
MLQNVKKALANPEPSTHGTSRHFVTPRQFGHVPRKAEISELRLQDPVYEYAPS